MNSVKTSLVVFGIYMIIIPGLGLMLFPEFILDLFGLSHGGFTWMARMIGLLAFIIGCFDLLIANHAVRPFYIWTVGLRYGAAVFMTILWLAGEVEIAILVFAAIDAAAATWTALTMNNSNTD